jgi:tRNA-dihydrouridine synthase B
MNLLSYLKTNPFVLSPMAGITDKPFRSFMREMGCGVVVTELVSAHGLEFNNQRTKKLMAFASDQHPIGIQLFGETPESLAVAAKIVEDAGADFVDLNFGCPVPKVVKKGAGSAMLKDLPGMREVLRATKSAVSIPVTIKVRTGWDQTTRNAIEVAQLAYDEGIEWMAIHGRTRAQAYTGLADWEYIASVKENSRIPILGNGDITNAETANRRLRETGCDGVLIGRGCLKNPWIFQEALGIVPHLDFAQMFSRLREHLEVDYDEKLTALQLKKFAAWFSAGYPSSAQFRKDIFQLQEKQAVLDRTFEFYSSLSRIERLDTSHEPFLMGGHG